MSLEIIPTTSEIKTFVIQVILVALVWVLFYQISLLLFSFLKYNTNVYWIFLPAGIRMFSVFIFGWFGVAGLFLGHVLTNHVETSNQLLYLAVVSSLSPMLAKRICKWFFNIPASLEGLTGRQLLVFTLACAFADASLSSQHFYHIGTFKYDHDFAPLFAGDLLGTLIILYLSKWLLGCVVKIYKPSF